MNSENNLDHLQVGPNDLILYSDKYNGTYFRVIQKILEDGQELYEVHFAFADTHMDWSDAGRMTDEPVTALSGLMDRGEKVQIIGTVPEWVPIPLTEGWERDIIFAGVACPGWRYLAVKATQFKEYKFSAGDTKQIATRYAACNLNPETKTWEIIQDNLDLLDALNKVIETAPGVQMVQGMSWTTQFARVAGTYRRCIILDSLLEVGDTVVVANTKEQREYRAKDMLPDGTELICVGFNQYEREVDFGWLSADRPRGVYLMYGAAIYRRAGEELGAHAVFGYDAHSLVFKDVATEKAAENERRKSEKRKMHDVGKWLRDIPDREFEIGDWVTTTHANGQTQFSDGCKFHHCEVTGKGTHRDEQEVTFGVDVYCISPDGLVERAWSLPFQNAGDLTLVKRGNLYWHLHDPSKIVFEDLRDEAHFHTMLGHKVQVKNPETGNYAPMEKEQLLELIRTGQACCMSVSPGFFGNPPQVHAYRYPSQPDLEERLRRETLKGFEVE